MPQLPEVETARRRLSPVLVGRSVEAVPQLDPKLFAGPRDQLEAGVVGRAVRRVGRRGKVLILAFDPPGRLLIHLKMTGQLVVLDAGAAVAVEGHPSPEVSAALPGRSTRAVVRSRRHAVFPHVSHLCGGV